MALTLDKAKAKELRKEWEESKASIEGGEDRGYTSLEQYFPNAE
jgi:hypothetical protein